MLDAPRITIEGLPPDDLKISYDGVANYHTAVALLVEALRRTNPEALFEYKEKIDALKEAKATSAFRADNGG